MRDHIRIAVVGCDGRPGSVANVLRLRTGGLAKIVAGIDPSDFRYELGQKKYDFKDMTRYGSIEEVLSAEKIDGIIIGSPNFFHLKNLNSLKGRKIPVLLEKPLDSTWEKICDVVRFCRGYEGPVLIGHCMRYSPVLVKAKEMISGGAIGKIGSANFVQYCHYGNGMYHTWRREMKNGGGMMIEKATHDIDVMQWLLDSRVKNVTASGRLVAFGGSKPPELHCQDCDEIFTCPESPLNISHRGQAGEKGMFELENIDLGVCSLAENVDVPDDEIALMTFENGIHGTYSQVFYSPTSFKHRVYTLCGTLGAMEIDLGEKTGRIRYSPRYGSRGDNRLYEFDYLGRSHYNGDGFMCRHFYEIITGNAAPRTTVEQAFFAEALGYAAILSEKEDRKVSISEIVPPDLRELLDSPLKF